MPAKHGVNSVIELISPSIQESELAARALNIQLHYIDVLDPKEIETAYQNAAQHRSQAVLVLQSPVFSSRRQLLVELAIKNRLPVIYPQSDYMDAGGIMFYGPSMADSFRRTAIYVDKILKGTKPVDLPVEQPTKFEFIINLKAAKQIGLTIPPNVLARADKVTK